MRAGVITRGLEALLCLAACVLAGAAGAGGEPPQPPADAAIRIEAYAWRDFMPISPPQGQPLAIVVRVLGHAPQPLEVREVRVIHGEDVWNSRLQPRTPSSPAVLAEGVARGGPLWTPGETIEVEAVVEMASGVHWRVRALPIVIQSTH